MLDHCISTDDGSKQDKNSANRSKDSRCRSVFNHCKCTVDKATQEDRNTEKSKENLVNFNYEYLDDYRDKRCDKTELSNSDDASSTDPEPADKGFIAKWGPEVFSRSHHPLALMVSYAYIQCAELFSYCHGIN